MDFQQDPNSFLINQTRKKKQLDLLKERPKHIGRRGNEKDKMDLKNPFKSLKRPNRVDFKWWIKIGLISTF